MDAEADCGCLPDCHKVNYNVEYTTERRTFYGSYSRCFMNYIHEQRISQYCFVQTFFSSGGGFSVSNSDDSEAPLLYRHYLDVTKRNNAKPEVRELVETIV